MAGSYTGRSTPQPAVVNNRHEYPGVNINMPIIDSFAFVALAAVGNRMHHAGDIANGTGKITSTSSKMRILGEGPLESGLMMSFLKNMIKNTA